MPYRYDPSYADDDIYRRYHGTDVATLSAQVEQLRRSIRHRDEQLYHKSLEVRRLQQENRQLRSDYSFVLSEYDRLKARLSHYRSRIYVKI